MAYPGALDLAALGKLNGIDLAEEGPAALGARAIDADGDGRPDLYLLDTDADGSVDGVVRAVDADGDGINDTFLQYGEDGQVASVGRIDPATGEIEEVWEEPGAIEELLASLGLVDLETPEQALFTSFDDPYILDTYGTFGDEVPEAWAAPDTFELPADTWASEPEEEPPYAEDVQVSEVDEAEAAVLDAESTSEGETVEDTPEVVPTIVEIEDRSGGDGSSVWARVDGDGDGLGDDDVRIERTSTGTWYGDIDRDGWSEDVASDVDMDGDIDTVSTQGEGSSLGTVDAEQVVDPADDHLVDAGADVDAGGSVTDTGDEGV